MNEHEEAERERLAQVLRGLGLTDRPAEYSDGIHSWRCEYPDRYGACDCFEEAVTTILNAVRKQEPVTEAEVEAAARAAWAHRWPLDERAEDIWRAMSEDARESAMRAGRAALDAARAVTNGDKQ